MILKLSSQKQEQSLNAPLVVLTYIHTACLHHSVSNHLCQGKAFRQEQRIHERSLSWARGDIEPGDAWCTLKLLGALQTCFHN
eukprot:491539-Pelagomonas_calceolata.AAC.2